MSRIWIRDDGLLGVECDYSQRGLVKDIGGRWDGLWKSWMVLFSVSNLEFLLDRLESPTLDEKIEKALVIQQKRDERLRRIKAMAKVDETVRLKVPGLHFPDGCSGLYNYQKIGTMFSITNDEGVLIGDEMGLGKSIQAIATSMFKKSTGDVKECLVVVPASLKYNWPLEIEKFTREKYVIIDGNPDNRIAQWSGKLYCEYSNGKIKYKPVIDDGPFFYVVNYELILEDLFGGRDFKENSEDTEEKAERKKTIKAKADARLSLLTPVRTKVWDMIVLDEVHAIKTHQSKRSRNIKKLNGKFRMGLSGTPLDGRLEELHSIMEFIRPGLFESKTRFMQKHAITDFWGAITGYKKIEEVTSRIEGSFIRRLKSDVLKDLPDKIYENIVVVLSDEEMKTYKALAKRKHEITMDVEAMTAVLRCKQFCDHPKLLGETCRHNSKIEALKEVLEEVVIENGNKALIFSQYKQMVEILVVLLEEMGLKYFRIDGDTPKLERAAMQEKFNNDSKIDICIGTEAMNAGLNLVGASYAIMYDDNWSPAIMRQRADRCHRIGQKDTVTVVNFICKDTIEERIRDVLYEKELISAEVIGDEIDEMVLKRLGPKDIEALL